jgi:hypothetical protein
MPRLPFPIGLEGSENLPRTSRGLQNCFNTGEDRIISRPGIQQVSSIDGVARAQFEWNGDLYQVQSEDLIKITDVTTGANTIVGNISGISDVEWDIGFNEAVLVVRGGEIFALSNSTTQIAITSVASGVGAVAQFVHAGVTPGLGDSVTISGFVVNTAYNVTNAIVTATTATTFDVELIPFGTTETGQFTNVLNKISGNANFVPCADVAQINGRFVYIPADGDPAFFSNVGAAGTVGALSFFDAETLPDKNNAVWNDNNTLNIAGTDSIEKFRDTGASPNPFTRINGSRINNGYIGGLLENTNTFTFIGREKGQDQGIYSTVQGGAQKISNERIDLILSTYTVAELGDAVSGRFKWRGFDISTFALPNDSFGFLNGNWFTLSTLVNNVVQPWRAGFITEFNKEYYTAFSNLFGHLTKINTDYGDPVPKTINASLENPEGDFFSAQSLQLGISQGFNVLNKSVSLRMSRDNVTFGPYVFGNLGSVGEYASILRWNPPGGLGNYQGYMAIEIYSAEDIDFSADNMILKLR